MCGGLTLPYSVLRGRHTGGEDTGGFVPKHHQLPLLHWQLPAASPVLPATMLLLRGHGLNPQHIFSSA